MRWVTARFLLVAMVSFFQGDRYQAAVSGLAILVFELDRSVMNTKVYGQTLLHTAQDRLTGGWRNIGNRNMAGESMHL